jgi:peroxiredoxin
MLLVFACLLFFPGQYNDVLSVGGRAPSWQNLPATDGKAYSLDHWKDKPYLLLVFTCNSCPCARDYEDRLKAFAARHASDVAVVAINANTIREDRLDAMKQRADQRGFNFTYLFDESQQVAKSYGATYTPEFFLLDNQRRVAYMGAMDDKDDPEKVTRHYLEEAVRALQAGKRPEKAETLARGCMIRYLKTRKK